MELNTIIFRLVLITLLAGAVGLERGYHKKPAGFRTNILVGIGSALFTILSANFPGTGALDASRIASQIVIGIGFLGAGTIIHAERAVYGLTTAATLWVVAALGMAIGAGFYREAIVAFILIMVVLLLFRWLENWIGEKQE